MLEFPMIHSWRIGLSSALSDSCALKEYLNLNNLCKPPSIEKHEIFHDVIIDVCIRITSPYPYVMVHWIMVVPKAKTDILSPKILCISWWPNWVFIILNASVEFRSRQLIHPKQNKYRYLYKECHAYQEYLATVCRKFVNFQAFQITMPLFCKEHVNRANTGEAVKLLIYS